MDNTSHIFTIENSTKASSKLSAVKSIRKKNISRDTRRSRAPIIPQRKRSSGKTNLSVSNNDDSKFIHCFYGILAQIILIASPSFMILIPVNNLLANPSYWYEIIFTTTPFALFASTAWTLLVISVLDDPFNKPVARVIADISMTYKVVETLSVCLLHLIWSTFLGFNEPFPFRQTLMNNLWFIVFILRCWYLIPKQTRGDETFRMRIKAFAFSGLLILFLGTQLRIMMFVCRRLFPDFQWIIAVMAFLTKEINDYIIGKFMIKSSSSENLVKTKFIGKIQVNIIYSLWLATSFIDIITKETEYLCLGINFCIDMSLCYKIIRMDGKIFGAGSDKNMNEHLKRDLLTELILNECVEVMLPIAFIGTFSIAYYGPNRNNFRKIGMINNLKTFLTPIVEMALIDSASVILASAALLWFCRINILYEYEKAIKKYWIFLAFWGGFVINLVFLQLMFSSGRDATTEFNWIRDDEIRKSYLQNLTLIGYDMTIV